MYSYVFIYLAISVKLRANGGIQSHSS